MERSLSHDTLIHLSDHLSIDSRIIFIQTTITWLSNSAFCFSLWLKLSGILDASWWMIFSPLWIYHWLHVPLNIAQIITLEDIIVQQIGPQPLASNGEDSVRLYQNLKNTKMRTYFINCISNLIDSFSTFISKAILAYQLDDLWLFGIPMSQIKFIFLPIWFGWLLITCFTCFKNKEDRTFGGLKDLTYLFLLIVAFKLDNDLKYSWLIIFFIPWIIFIIIYLLASMMLALLILTRSWNKLSLFLIKFGFFLILISTMPIFCGLINLSYKLDGNENIPLVMILIPFSIGWFLMWFNSVVMCFGLRLREIEREFNNRHLMENSTLEDGSQDLEYDQMNDDEIKLIVDNLMEGKTTPGHLIKIGQDLFKKISSSNLDDNLTFEKEINQYLINEEQKDNNNDVNQEEIEKGDNVKNIEKSDQSQISEKEQCIICFEGKGLFVFLECGHGGFCKTCAYRLFIRTPRKCPTCRQNIDQVVELNEIGNIGDLIPIKFNEKE